MKKLLITLGLVLVTATNGCASNDPTGPGDGKHRVLFIGNSYLFTTDIPAIVQAMAAYNGDDLTTTTVAGPDMALYDHLSSGGAVAAIAQGGWSYVVLQQGPSSVSYNRDSLRMATAIYDGMAKQVSAKTALFSAWPQYVNRADFPRAIESYRLAAQDVHGLFIPVASAWLKAWELDPSIELYADGLHPSPAGAYLAALVVYSAITQRSPAGMPASIGGVNIDEGTAAILQMAAASVTMQ
jgi:hypothetical protein